MVTGRDGTNLSRRLNDILMSFRMQLLPYSQSISPTKKKTYLKSESSLFNQYTNILEIANQYSSFFEQGFLPGGGRGQKELRCRSSSLPPRVLGYVLHKSAIFIRTLMNVFKLCFQGMSYTEFVLKHVVLKVIHHIITESINQFRTLIDKRTGEI